MKISLPPIELAPKSDEDDGSKSILRRKVKKAVNAKMRMLSKIESKIEERESTNDLPAIDEGTT